MLRSTPWARQQSCVRCSATPFQRGRKRHSRRVGSTEASWLPAPPVSTVIALPLQIVPSASASTNVSLVARATALASRLAGNEATMPDDQAR